MRERRSLLGLNREVCRPLSAMPTALLKYNSCKIIGSLRASPVLHAVIMEGVALPWDLIIRIIISRTFVSPLQANLKEQSLVGLCIQKAGFKSANNYSHTNNTETIRFSIKILCQKPLIVSLRSSLWPRLGRGRSWARSTIWASLTTTYTRRAKTGRAEACQGCSTWTEAYCGINHGEKRWELDNGYTNWKRTDLI